MLDHTADYWVVSFGVVRTAFVAPRRLLINIAGSCDERGDLVFEVGLKRPLYGDSKRLTALL